MVIKTGKITVPHSAPGEHPSYTIVDAAITASGRIVLTPAELDSMTDTRGQMEFYAQVTLGQAKISGELPELKDDTDLYYVLDTDGTGGASFGALNYKGVWDASTTVYPTSPAKGDYYIVSVAGTISGKAYSIGDMMTYNGASWDKVEGGVETDPVFNAWLVTPPSITTFSKQVTNTLYVDNKRTDIYTPDGSITKPFLNIQDAVTAIVGASATNRFLIDISPGANYTDPFTIDEINVTLRGGGSISTRVTGKVTVATSTLGQITFQDLMLRGAFECHSSHIAINVIDCNVATGAWDFTPTVVTDDEYLQVWGGLWNSNVTLVGVYAYLMNGGFYSTFNVTDKEFNINNADINTPFTAILSGTLAGSAFGNRTGSSAFTLNAGVTMTMDADTEGGSVITLAGGTLVRSTKAVSIINVPAGAIASTDVQAAINELDTDKPTISSGVAAPGTTPTKIGDVFIDTANKKLYFAAGTTNSGDWILTT